MCHPSAASWHKYNPGSANLGSFGKRSQTPTAAEMAAMRRRPPARDPHFRALQRWHALRNQQQA